MANINKNEIGYNENTTANALMVQYKRGLAAPMDISEVFTSLMSAEQYAKNDPISYAGQTIAVAGDGIKTEIYKITSGGTLVRLIDENDLSSFELPDNLATTDYVESYVDGMASNLTEEAQSYTDGKLEYYATKSYVTEHIVSAMTGGEIELTGYAKVEYVDEKNHELEQSVATQLDAALSVVEESVNWVEVEGDNGPQKVRHWRGYREKYEFLRKNNALSPWTRYSVIDEIQGENIITEYFGENQISEAHGQLLPVNEIISTISEGEAQPYNRYLVGVDGEGYNVYECVFNDNNTLRWRIKPFDYRYGVRVISEGLKNYIYVNDTLRTYDDVDAGEF